MEVMQDDSDNVTLPFQLSYKTDDTLFCRVIKVTGEPIFYSCIYIGWFSDYSSSFLPLFFFFLLHLLIND